jgi:hypothetical protein
MGRHSTTGGVIAVGQDRIQFAFQFEGRRFRPTLADDANGFESAPRSPESSTHQGAYRRRHLLFR